MLPLIPIAAAVTSAAVLIRRKIQNNIRKSKHNALIAYAKSQKIPTDSEGNFNPDALLPNGIPLLFTVIYSPELLTSLLEYGANPNICNAEGVPAIVYATSYKRPDEAAIRLKYGAAPNSMDSEGKTAILYAKKAKLLQQLYNAGADFNAIDIHGKTALFDLVEHYSLINSDAIKALVTLGTDVNARDNDGKSVVFYATRKPCLSILKELGADFNAVDNNGKTPLFYSFVNHTTRELIENGANPSIKDPDGKTVFFYISGEDDFPLVTLMERYGLNIEDSDNSGNKAEYYESYLQFKKQHINDVSNVETSKLLAGNLSPEQNLWRANSDKFYNAVNYNKIEIVRELVKGNVDLDTRDKSVPSWNMIHLAVYRNNPEMIEVLAKAGVDINGNNGGNTPLSKAVYDNRVDCFKKLLELGADPNTAKPAVEYCGSPEIKRIFQEFTDGKYSC